LKRFSSLIPAFLLAGILLSACAGQTTAPNKLKIATDATFAPFETANMTTKELSGFDIDLMKVIASKAGFEVEFSNVAFSRMLTGVAKCQYDAGISAITPSAALKGQIAFSDPYLTFGQVLVVKKGNILINGREQLPGMTVGSQNGSPGATEIMKIPGAQLQAYDSYDLAFQDLVTGFIDAVVAGQPRAQSYAAIKANNLKIVGDPFATETYAVAICLKNPDLLQKINAGLAAVKADGTLDRLSQKWLKTAPTQ
jgi:polar amino acid transport system substrate-binding protein